MILKLLFILLFGFQSSDNYELIVHYQRLDENFSPIGKPRNILTENCRDKHKQVSHDISNIEALIWYVILHDQSEKQRIKLIYEKSI